MKILVIEDEESIRSNLVEFLEIEEFEVLEASNGTQGIQVAQAQYPDLILCDIMMPDLDGYEVLKILQEEVRTALIPLIFLTARTTREDVRKGMELGADDYITKPCTHEELIRAIKSRLAKHAVYIQQYQSEKDCAKKLQRKIQELESISQNAEDLLQKISEELRDPLSSITMAIQMLKVAPEESKQRYLKILEEECSREISLINQITDLKNTLNNYTLKKLRKLDYD